MSASDELGPVGPYEREPVAVRPHDPRAALVADVLARRIAAARPGTGAEHVGSSAVPGLPGKGIVDLLVAVPAQEVAEVAGALARLGFQPQAIAEAFPAARPMLQGSVALDGRRIGVHVHVVPADRSEVAELRGLRDALRADPDLRAAYAALKERIVAAGTTDGVAYAAAKGDWIAAALTRLGLRPAPLVTRLDHLVLQVTDADRTVAFYRDVLGMTPVTFGTGRRALAFGPHKLNLHRLGAEPPSLTTPARPGTADLCLIVSSPVPDLLARLAAHGVAVVEGPVPRTGALGPITSVYVHDPDGNLLELATYD